MNRTEFKKKFPFLERGIRAVTRLNKTVGKAYAESLLYVYNEVPGGEDFTHWREQSIKRGDHYHTVDQFLSFWSWPEALREGCSAVYNILDRRKKLFVKRETKRNERNQEKEQAKAKAILQNKKLRNKKGGKEEKIMGREEFKRRFPNIEKGVRAVRRLSGKVGQAYADSLLSFVNSSKDRETNLEIMESREAKINTQLYKYAVDQFENFWLWPKSLERDCSRIRFVLKERKERQMDMIVWKPKEERKKND